MSSITKACPYCFSWFGRCDWKNGHCGFLRPSDACLEGVSEMMKRRQTAAQILTMPEIAQINKELAKYPELVDFLFMRVWPEDGKQRETGTVLVFGDGSCLKVMLNDRDQGLVAFVTCEGQKPLLKALEDALGSPGTDWRPAKKYVKK